jgi:hypothetical protein
MPVTKPSVCENPLREEPRHPARELGRQEGELFDLRLREQETRQRERRLTEMLWVPGGSPSSRHNEAEIARLRGQIDELSDYHKAVEKSAAWRAIQSLRGLFGRAW